MKYPPLTASSVFRNNQPNTWVVRVNAFGGPTIADCGEDGEKFAKLFAAAPGLLKALQGLVGHLTTVGGNPDLRFARAAIAEATGESQ
jgi:hypothetical protein